MTIRVDGFPELNVTTNANGEFTLVDVPAPDFFVQIDGLTSTTDGPIDGDGFYPNVAKEFQSVPGEETVIPFDIYLSLIHI